MPPERVLYLIPFLLLTSLIAARGVYTRWRSVEDDVSPPRARGVKEVYLAAIASRFP